MDKAKEILDAIEDKLRTNGVARIVTHLDADGLASASILCKTLKHLNIPFHLRVVKQLTTEIAKDLLEGSSDDDFIIFTDLGSGHKDLLRKLFSKRTFAIIDHHIPSDLGNDLLELNPHIFGFDGSKECSASTACYFIAKACKLHLAKIAAKLAIVGAIGDRQDCGDKSSFIGLNEVVVKEAIDLGILRCKMSLKLFGAETRPIFKALEYTSDPYLPGLTGNELACKKFLENLGICTGESCSKTLSDLSDEELKKLTSELINHLLSHGVSVKSAESLVGWIYTFIDEAEDTPFRDARESSHLF
ncbi:MAG: hypothetical protein DRJ31_00740 [Candidatus Methanomethylicota archaeon]|uniref:DHH family phosphoesterase n=1 Tax=Thermoproteota archaeon TaxID=2056631 RepID=A0A497ETW1_9CREN|nr:MAG: hypothetical protein DRJ31_00740 [Candidatus Verstraetearchaeota archaeon]